VTRALRYFLEWITPGRAVLLFLLMVLPTVFAPYHADDYFHLLILQGDPLLQRGGDGSLFGLFSFVDDNPQHREQLLRYGVLPWWASENYHFRFLRPLGEVTHWLDFQLFGDRPMVAHIHSILWFLLGALLFWKVLRKIMGKHGDGKLLLFAFVLFLWDGQHIGTISWIANRSALMAFVFALGSLYFHVEWREGKRGFFAPVAAHLLLLVALACGEIALAIFGYLLAYAVFLDRNRFVNSLFSLSGYGLLVLGYIVLYQQLGFGASTSDSYINPVSDPAGFLSAGAERFLVYLNSAFLPIPAGSSWIGGVELWYLTWLLVALGVLVLVAVLYLFLPLLKRDRQLAFWFSGAMLSVIPILAALPQDRLTIFMTAGMAVFVAMVIGKWLLSGKGERVQIAVAKAMLVIHFLLSPLYLLGGTTFMAMDTWALLDRAKAFDDQVPVVGKKLLVLEMPLGISISMMGMRKAVGETLPESMLTIGNEEGDTTYRLLSDREILVNREPGFAIGYESVFRSVRREPFRKGDEIALHNVVITVLDVTREGTPISLLVTLDEPMDSGNWLFFHFERGWVKPSDLATL
jgi:hypothetical protein